MIFSYISYGLIFKQQGRVLFKFTWTLKDIFGFDSPQILIIFSLNHKKIQNKNFAQNLAKMTAFKKHLMKIEHNITKITSY